MNLNKMFVLYISKMSEYEKFMKSIEAKSDATKKQYRIQYNKLFNKDGTISFDFGLFSRWQLLVDLSLTLNTYKRYNSHYRINNRHDLKI